MAWTVDSSQTEDSWFADLVTTVLASPCVGCKLPPKRQHLGATEATWFETEPGIAFIRTIGGSPDDRVLAEAVLRAELEAQGYRQAHFTFEPDENSELRKEATWNDVMAKAKRLIQSGNVTLLRNGLNNIVGHVIGDHGEYQTEISRDDPDSQVITQWQCECPWDQFAFQRTRKWKKLEGRPCAHVLATYWVSRRTPLDEQRPEAQGQGQLFAPGPAIGTPAPMRAPTPAPLSPGLQLSIPGVAPGTADTTPPVPSGGVPGPDVMPPFPGTQQMEVNPVSVPGLRQPSPMNPIQYPGGTFSSVTAENWDFGENWVFESAKGDDFENSDMAQVMKATYGVAEGKSTDHGAGSYREIPKNAIVEVLGQDATTGWVDCIWPLNDSGPLEPFHVRAWIPAEDLTPRPDIKRPGPFIKRRGNVELAAT